MIVRIRRRRQRNLDLQADIEELTTQISEFNDLEETLSTVLDEKNEKEVKLQEVLTSRVLHFQKIVDLLRQYSNRPDKFQEKVSEAVLRVERDNYFGALQDVVNEKYVGVIDYLKLEYPTLTEDELNLCSLLCFEFDNSLIGVIFGHTNPKSVFNKRLQLRKKLGVVNSDSLETHLSKVIADLQSKSDASYFALNNGEQTDRQRQSTYRRNIRVGKNTRFPRE
ncbi:MAG: hypothetical protein LBV02_01780 [Bacteroidales bacterium]|nr:hypothetical protein [Bacteroidales bacterium]